MTQPKKVPFIKNAQFQPNLTEIQAILPTHVIVILTNFHKDRLKNVDFLLLAYFGASVIFFVTVSTLAIKNLIHMGLDSKF